MSSDTNVALNFSSSASTPLTFLWIAGSKYVNLLNYVIDLHLKYERHPILNPFICLVHSSILVYWKSPFPILEVPGVLNFDRNLCKQTVEIPRSAASDLGLIVCQGPKSGTL